MTKKEHHRILYRDVQNAQRHTDAELAKSKALLNEIVPKLVKISLIEDRSFMAGSDRMRLVLDMDPMMIREAFMWGNDNRAIEYFAESIKYKVMQELRTANMQRFNADVLYPMNERYRR